MRKAVVKRKTKETDIMIKLELDGNGRHKISTGIAFLDHMLSLFAKHGLFDIELKAKGDLDVDLHHTNEDIGIALGEVFAKTLKDKRNLVRFADAFTVLDESLVRVIVDISGRPYLRIKPKSSKLSGKGYNYGSFTQLLRAFVNGLSITVHIDVLQGEDFHHILECCFKGLALALDKATRIDQRKKGLPTTKGKL